jgi:hypothetical protein
VKEAILILALVGCSLPRVLVAQAADASPVGAVALPDDGGPAQTHAGTTLQADQKIDALLRQIVRQVMMGQTVLPDDDNALSTWLHFLNVAMPPSPTTLKALTDFATDTRRRAAEAQAAGQAVIASNLSIFTAQADELLQQASNSSLPAAMPLPTSTTPVQVAPPATLSAEVAAQGAQSSESPSRPAPSPAPATTLSAEVTTHDAQASESPRGPGPSPAPPARGRSDINPADVQRPPVDSGSTGSPVALAALNKEPVIPTPTVGALAIPSVTVAPPPHPDAAEPLRPGGTMPPHSGGPTQTAHQQAAVAAAVNRGDAMLASKDISAARGFYEYAAKAGNARAATALAETYDPAFLNRLGVIGPKPNPALAADWYRRAAALGDRKAEARLLTLATEAAK